MARPKKEPELVTTHRVTIRFSDTQYAVISEDAKRAGLPLADYLRKLIANHGLTLSYKIVRDDMQSNNILADVLPAEVSQSVFSNLPSLVLRYKAHHQYTHTVLTYP